MDDGRTDAELEAARKAHWAKIATEGNHPLEIAALSELARSVLPSADIEFWSLGTEDDDEPTICVHNAGEAADEAWYELSGTRLLGREIFSTVVFDSKTGKNLGAYITLTQQLPGEDDDVDGGFELVPLHSVLDLPEAARFPNLQRELVAGAEVLHGIDPGLQVVFLLTDSDEAFKNPTVLGLDILQRDAPRYHALNLTEVSGRRVMMRVGSFDGERWNAWLTYT